MGLRRESRWEEALAAGVTREGMAVLNEGGKSHSEEIMGVQDCSTSKTEKRRKKEVTGEQETRKGAALEDSCKGGRPVWKLARQSYSLSSSVANMKFLGIRARTKLRSK